MTPKQIRYSDHAAMRLRQRGITRQAVRAVLAQGLAEAARSDAGEPRWITWGKWKGRDLGVVYVERAAELLVVTVQWRDEG